MLHNCGEFSEDKFSDHEISCLLKSEASSQQSTRKCCFSLMPLHKLRTSQTHSFTPIPHCAKLLCEAVDVGELVGSDQPGNQSVVSADYRSVASHESHKVTKTVSQQLLPYHRMRCLYSPEPTNAGKSSSIIICFLPPPSSFRSIWPCPSLRTPPAAWESRSAPEYHRTH